jgi:hypothetical protein
MDADSTLDGRREPVRIPSIPTPRRRHDSVASVRALFRIVVVASVALGCTETPSNLPACLGIQGSPACAPDDAGTDADATDASDAAAGLIAPTD